MDALAILGAAASAVLQVLVLASAGAYLELKGYLGAQRRRVLSDVSFRIFLPCLLFTSVCESASIEALTKQYCLPLFMVLYVVLGYLLGWFLSRFTTEPDDEFSSTHFIFSCALNNVGYLPLILVPATILQGALHNNGSDLAIEVKRGVSCVGLCILVMNVCTWSLAATALRKVAKDKQNKEIEKEKQQQQIEQSVNTDTNTPTTTTSTPSNTSTGHKVKGIDNDIYDQYYNWFCKYYIPPIIAKILANIMDFAVSVINPPVAGALSGLCIGLISPLRGLFFASKPLGLLASSTTSTTTNVMNNVVPNIATLFNIQNPTLLSTFQTCITNNNIINSMTMFIRNQTGWYLCNYGTLFNTTILSTCCISLPLVSEIISVANSQDSHSLLTMIGNNITSQLLYTTGMSNSLIDVVNTATLQASDVEGINVNSQINTGLASVSNGPKVAPLQPIITSAMQAFAAAIIPTVAITLGSNIVARETPVKKVETLPVTTSNPPTAIAINEVNDNTSNNNQDNDIQVIKSTPNHNTVLYYITLVYQYIRTTIIFLWNIALGKDPIEGTQIVRTKVLLGIIFSRMIYLPLVGILLTYAGSKLGIVPGNDRTLVFVLLVEAATPTAMNLQLISDVMGSGSRAMARVIAVTYVLSVISLTVWISVALALIRNGVFENNN